ncbi:hypothetical protein ABID13_002643 [Enterocloster citroniae]|uniref:Uncharacterized protein n=1 Tax=Enterocloster citroniae TaxID=358743 RepID=A0ABV2FY92_9FIRM
MKNNESCSRILRLQRAASAAFSLPPQCGFRGAFFIS